MVPACARHREHDPFHMPPAQQADRIAQHDARGGTVIHEDHGPVLDLDPWFPAAAELFPAGLPQSPAQHRRVDLRAAQVQAFDHRVVQQADATAGDRPDGHPATAMGGDFSDHKDIGRYSEGSCDLGTHGCAAIGQCQDDGIPAAGKPCEAFGKTTAGFPKAGGSLGEMHGHDGLGGKRSECAAWRHATRNRLQITQREACGNPLDFATGMEGFRYPAYANSLCPAPPAINLAGSPLPPSGWHSGSVRCCPPSPASRECGRGARQASAD